MVLALLFWIIYLILKKPNRIKLALNSVGLPSSPTWINPVIGKVTSKYGDRINPITGLSQFHNGVDISVPTGTDIFAPFDGSVAEIYENSVGGKQMILNHSNGFKTGYAHLSAYDVFVGKPFLKGEVLAKTGMTGAVTGPHLHFTLKNEQGDYVNPLDVFSFNS